MTNLLFGQLTGLCKGLFKSRKDGTDASLALPCTMHGFKALGFLIRQAIRPV